MIHLWQIVLVPINLTEKWDFFISENLSAYSEIWRFYASVLGYTRVERRRE